MKSITIHNLDKELDNAIKKLARQTKTSQNKTIKSLLRKALGLSDVQKKSNDFSAFCGIWSSQESKAFSRSIERFEKIDKELWK